MCLCLFFFFFSSRRRHTRCGRDWSSDVCSSDLRTVAPLLEPQQRELARERLVLRKALDGLLEERARGGQLAFALVLTDPVGDRPLRLRMTRIQGAQEPLLRLAVFALHPVEHREVEYGRRVVGTELERLEESGLGGAQVADGLPQIDTEVIPRAFGHSRPVSTRRRERL